MLFTTIVCALAGLGAGLGTGFAGISAATVISPMLSTLLGIPAYQAICIALASDVLASAASARTYAKNKNIDVANGFVMLISVLIMTMVGSLVASFLPNSVLGNFATLMTLFLGIKFLVKPVTTTKEHRQLKSKKQRIRESLISGIYIGFVCGFIGAGGGLMMLFVLTVILGYDLKDAVGTSVFVMTFTALTGAVSHLALGGVPPLYPLFVCIVVTLVSAQLGAVIANKSETLILNRITGTILAIIGASMTAIHIYSAFFAG